MGFFSRYKNIFLFLIIFAVLAGGYVYFFQDDGGDELLVSTGPSVAATEVGRELLQLGATLRSIKLDDSIFSDPAFRALEDFSQELTPEPVGRVNPFAPLGSSGGAAR